MIVHVVAPGGRPRWQREFADGTPDVKVLSQLASGSRIFGYTRSVVKPDSLAAAASLGSFAPSVPHPDRTSTLVWDDPETVVAVGVIGPGNSFVEQRRIKGPPLPPPETPETDPAVPTIEPELKG